MEVLVQPKKICNVFIIGQWYIKIHITMIGPMTNAKGRTISHKSMSFLWYLFLSWTVYRVGNYFINQFVISHGMMYILVVVDYVFKRVEADALPNNKGWSIIAFLKKKYFLLILYSTSYHQWWWIPFLQSSVRIDT